jgi:hypothetical protein
VRVAIPPLSPIEANRIGAKVDTGVERYLRQCRLMHPLSLYLTAAIASVEIAAAEDASELRRSRKITATDSLAVPE